MSLLKTGLIVAGVGALVYAAYNYYKVETTLLENSDYQITDMSIDSYSLQDITFKIGLQLNNGSDINVNLQSLYLDIYIDGTNVGYVMQQMQTPIAPKGTAIIPLTATVGFSNALNIATSHITDLFNKKTGLDVKAVGTVVVSSGFVSTTVPISFEKTISISI